MRLTAGWRYEVPSGDGEAVLVAVRGGLGRPAASRPVLLRVSRPASAGTSAGLWLPAGAAWWTGVQLIQAAEDSEEPDWLAPEAVRSRWGPVRSG